MSELADIFFADLAAPRAINARRHSWRDVLVIALCTVLSGGQTGADMELFGHAKRDLLQSFLKLENGIPSHDTFSRALMMLAPKAFGQWFLRFMGQFAESIAGVVALDGKALRLSCDRAKGNHRCTWSALGPKSGVVRSSHTAGGSVCPGSARLAMARTSGVLGIRECVASGPVSAGRCGYDSRL